MKAHIPTGKVFPKCGVHEQDEKRIVGMEHPAPVQMPAPRDQLVGTIVPKAPLSQQGPVQVHDHSIARKYYRPADIAFVEKNLEPDIREGFRRLYTIDRANKNVEVLARA